MFELCLNRFWSKANKISPNDCWEWIGSRTIKGYGLFCIEGKNMRAHRLSWQVANGEIPEGLCVCHHCDNPSCVNPNHLFLGTNQDNTKDRVRKGRSAFGVKHGRSMLNETKVRVIRAYYPSISAVQLAKIFGMARSSIGKVVRRETWTHI